MEDKHQRITQAQFDIWIDSPVTKVYLQCLKWTQEQVIEPVGNFSLIDSASNEQSMNRIHKASGQNEGLNWAQLPKEIINRHAMLGVDND